VAANAPTSNPKPGLQDDMALFHYLQVARNPIPGAIFFRMARERLLKYEAEQQRYGKEVLEAISLTFSTFSDNLQTGTLLPPVNHSLWQSFLAYYKANTKRKFQEKSQWLRANYFARDVLLFAIQEDKNNAFNAITIAYKASSRMVIERMYPTKAVDFDDVYQEAILSLFRSPPSPNPEKAHTAQLFSIFRTHMVFRAADIFQLERRSDPPEDLTDNPLENCNNINDFTDHIIETNNLAELFGSDNLNKILEKALNKLGPDCRSLLKYKYFHLMRHREIAEKQGWSTNSVGTRVSRCIDKLKKILKGGKK